MGIRTVIDDFDAQEEVPIARRGVIVAHEGGREVNGNLAMGLVVAASHLAMPGCVLPATSRSVTALTLLRAQGQSSTPTAPNKRGRRIGDATE